MSWGERDRWSEKVSLAGARRGPFYLIGEEESVYLLSKTVNFLSWKWGPNPADTIQAMWGWLQKYCVHPELSVEIDLASCKSGFTEGLVHFYSKSLSSEWLWPNNLPEIKWSVLGDLLLSHSWNCQKTTILFIATTETDKLTQKFPKRKTCILAHSCRQSLSRLIALGLRQDRISEQQGLPLRQEAARRKKRSQSKIQPLRTCPGLLWTTLSSTSQTSTVSWGPSF